MIFAHFFIWVHCPQHDLPLDSIDDTLISLDIFAERCQIRLLLNQVSDLLRKNISANRWKPNSDTMRAIYSGVPANSILRRLSSLGLTVQPKKYARQMDWTIWETVFTEHADLGWDYFRRIQKDQTSTYEVASSGACRFHDHSDVPGWIRTELRDCPYPEGAPVEGPRNFGLSASVSGSRTTDGKVGSESRIESDEPFRFYEPADSLQEDSWA